MNMFWSICKIGNIKLMMSKVESIENIVGYIIKTPILSAESDNTNPYTTEIIKDDYIIKGMNQSYH